MHNYCFFKFLSDEWTWLKVTFSESTRQMHESTWQMQMVYSGDNGKPQSLSQIDQFFLSVVKAKLGTDC